MKKEAVRAYFDALRRVFEAQKDYLNELDARQGDGDHGSSMARGYKQAALQVAELGDVDVGTLFSKAGRTFMSEVGGASGPLFAMIFLETGKCAEGAEALSLEHLSEGLRNAAEKVTRLGRSARGDKTLLDALIPAAEALAEQRGRDGDLLGALYKAYQVAKDEAEATEGLKAKKGRAHYVEGGGEGYPDPGATSTALLLKTLYETCERWMS